MTDKEELNRVRTQRNIYRKILIKEGLLDSWDACPKDAEDFASLKRREERFNRLWREW